MIQLIYTQQGLATSNMKEVNSPYSDFETLASVKTIVVSPEALTTEMKLPNNQITTVAKGKLSFYFVAGELKGKRSNANLLYRSLVGIDYDSLPVSYEQAKSQIQANFGDYSYFIYPTISHSENDTRMRLIVDCDRNMNKSEFEATLKEIGELIGLPFDEASLTYSQLMALPITDDKEKLERLKFVNYGKPFRVQEVAQKDLTTKPFIASYSCNAGGDGKGKIVQLLEEVMEGIATGNRNKWFAKAFGILLKANMEVNAAMALCFEWNSRYTEEPLSQRELEGVLISILNRELKKKGGI